ncbi:calponin homology domain-containing protein [Dethiobacter alkaliphilus]|uniref:hypothetical protein n=1 Tax=Dethiobacter alkaliphilus TaxID=427926 RepID=UPI0022276BAB|nr:hypothetical protein [Dethiobacter alkaliphilus]MCW3491708.1 hypothetical protein [Dethiobacter alkaliphilus]
MEDALIGAIVLWAVSALFMLLPEQLLKVQTETYKMMGAEFRYTAKTVRFIRLMSLGLIVVGFIVFFFG